MAEPKSYFFVGDPGSGGVNSKDNVRDLADNESPFILNMDIYQKGRVISRTGYEKWGDPITAVTGGFRGLLRYYRSYGTDSGDYLLSFHSNGNGYKSTNTTPTPASIDTYGTDSGAVRGIVFNNTAVIGNGLAANVLKKWEGTGNLATLGGTPPDSKVFGCVNHCLLAVATGTRTLYWADVDDAEDWTTGIASNTVVQTKDGGAVRAIFEANDQGMCFGEFSKHMMDLTFDNSDILARFAFKEKVDSSGGCCATGSVQHVVNTSGEMVVYLSAVSGFQSYGAIESYSDKRNPSDISYKIQPTTAKINFSAHDVINSETWKDKYICLVPFESSSKNNYAFVYSKEYGSWTLYNGMGFSDVTRFRDAFGQDQLIYASNGDPQLYKANNSFSDDGVGYDRAYVSKTWDFGNRTRIEWIDFSGSKVVGKDIYIDVWVDGRQLPTRKVTDTNLIQGTGGGYVADNWVGDNYAGGGFGNAGPNLYLWRGRFPITKTEGQNVYFKIYNNSDGGGFSFHTYGIKIAPVSAEVAKNVYSGEGGYLEPVI